MARDQKANEQWTAEQAMEAESQAALNAPDTTSTPDVWGTYRRGTWMGGKKDSELFADCRRVTFDVMRAAWRKIAEAY